MINDKVVLITGASRGLGFSLVKKFLFDGYKVIALTRNVKSLKSSIKNYKIKTQRLIVKKCDISNEKDIKSTVSFIKNYIDKIDVIINNAGVRFEDSISKTSLTKWNESLSVNLTSSFLITKYFLPFLIEAKKAILFNISSIRGIIGGGNLAAYSASKFGMIGLTLSLAEELKPYRIKCYSLCPAGIKTHMALNTNLSFSKKMLIKPNEISKILLEIIENRVQKSGKTIVILGRQGSVKKKIKKANDYKYFTWF